MRVADDDLRVRPARLDDCPRVAELLRALDLLHAEIQPGFFRRPPAPDPAAVRRLVDEKNTCLLVAERRDRDPSEIVGVVRAVLYDTPASPEMAPRRRANIESLVVAPPCRRRGAGRRLLRAVEAWARSRGAGQVVLTVWSGNEEADAFYRAVGYATASQVLCRELG